MIRLRQLIDRGRRHPLLGPLVILLLVLLIALTMLHEGHESVTGDVGVLCVGIALLLMTAVVLASVAPFMRLVAAALAARGPPAYLVDTAVFGRNPPSSLPLRL